MTENVQGPFFVDRWESERSWYVKIKEPNLDDEKSDRKGYYIIMFGISTKERAQEHANRLNAYIKLWLEGQQNV